MNLYHVHCNLKEGVSDLDFADRARAYFAHLEAEGLIAGYRIMRRKLGLGPPALREFHIMLEFEDLAQLDRAFERAASRSGPIEGFHQAVNSLVSDAFFALYRDFPDPGRVRGEEKF